MRTSLVWQLVVLLTFIGLMACNVSAGNMDQITFDAGTPIDTKSGKLLNRVGSACQMEVRGPSAKDSVDGKILSIKITERKGEKSGMSSTLSFPSPIDFYKGRKYRVTFQARCSTSANIGVGVKQIKKPWSYVGTATDSGKILELNSDWQLCSLFFTATRDWKASEVTLGFFFGTVPQHGRLELGPITLEELSSYQTLDLKSVVNFGFADEIAKDGKGGWSDQGPNNDFANFPFKSQWFSHIPFDVIDPAKNNGKAILSFECDNVRSGLKKVEIPVPAGAAELKYFYLLHASAWTPAKGTAVGKIHFIGEDGQENITEVLSGRDLAEWWNPRRDISNAKLALEIANKMSKIGAYVSGFDVPAGTQKIILETTGAGAWMVVGATLADFDAFAEKQSIEIITEGDRWKPIDTSSLFIKPGSALDFSASALPSPCGVDGRVMINDKGQFAFENQPEKAVRFTGFGVLPMSLIWWPEKFIKADLDAYADAVVRQGYNLVRLHIVEDMLFLDNKGPWEENKLFDKPEDIKFVSKNLDFFHYLIYCLKQRGVYIVLDVFGSKDGYTGSKPYGPNKFKAFREKMYYDDSYRANWQAGVTKLLTIENPYTHTTLATDPVVAFIHLNNEQHLTWSPEILEGLNPMWQAWAKENTDFDAIPPLSREEAKKTGKMADAMNHFVADMEIDLNCWYEQIVRGFGYEGLINNWNNTSPMMRVPPRAMLQVVTQNIYFSHPKDYNHPGSVISQNSTVGITWDFTGLMRFLDRPFVPTEHATPAFWTRYRHEQGIHFTSYAALQDWSGLCLHSSPVIRRTLAMDPFCAGRDPVIRAAEVYTHFAFGRGYVSPAKHSIAYPVSDEIIFAGHAQDGFDLTFGQLFMMTKTGILYNGNNHPDAVSVKADLEVSPVGGAILTDHGMFETVKAGVGSNVTQATIDKVVRKMRQKKMLDAQNQSNPASGIFQSDTNEITKNIKEETMTVITPRLEAAVVKKDKPINLNKVKIDSCSLPAAISMITLDENKSLTESPHLLLIFNTDALNSGMSFTSKHRNELIDNGKLPVLMETGVLTLSMETSALIAPKVFALKLDGSREDKIVAEVKDGRLVLTIDTAKLSAGPTPFFEIVQ